MPWWGTVALGLGTLAIGGLVGWVLRTTRQLGRLEATPAETRGMSPHEELLHNLRTIRAQLTAAAEELTAHHTAVQAATTRVLTHLEKSSEFRWPTVTSALERQSRALEDAATSIRLTSDLLARVLASGASPRDSVG